MSFLYLNSRLARCLGASLCGYVFRVIGPGAGVGACRGGSITGSTGAIGSRKMASLSG